MAAGHDIQVVAVNKDDAADAIDSLTARCSYPVLQDTYALDVWGLMDGHKDDFYLYDAAGVLVAHLPTPGDVDTNLSTDAGYTNLKNAIVAVDQPQGR